MTIDRNGLVVVLLLMGVASAGRSQALRMGLQLTISQPQGDLGAEDLLDHKLGFGVGANLQIPMGRGIALVPRIDYTLYSREDSTGVYGVSQTAKLKFNVFSGGADFNYYPGGTLNQGFYGLLGLGYSSANYQFDVDGAWHLSDRETKRSVYAAAGLGVCYSRRLSFELRYLGVNAYTFAAREVSGPSLNISILFRD